MLKFTDNLAPMDVNSEEKTNRHLRELMTQIQSKNNQLMEKGNWNLNYFEAGQAAFRMNSSLQQAATEYFNDLPTAYNTNRFVRACRVAINTGKKEFGDHPGWCLVHPFLTALLDLLRALKATAILAIGNGASSMFFDRL